MIRLMSQVSEIPVAPIRLHPRLRWGLFAVALLLGIALDLGTKAYAFDKLPDRFACERHPEVWVNGEVYAQARRSCNKCREPLTNMSTHRVTSWFAFTRATNPGAAFGMFKGQHTFFMIVTVAAFVALPYFVHTARRYPLPGAILLGLILAGVFGNFWDRVLYNEVRDFLDFHTPPEGALHDFFKGTVGRTIWPTFNVADMFITGGAIFILVSQFFMGEVKDGEAASEAEETKPEEPKPEPETETEPEPEAEAEPEAEPESEAKDA